MASNNFIPQSADEMVALITKTAEELKLDDFRVRVQRKRAGSPVPDQVLTLDGAKAEHFSAPETWLPQISGGGLYLLTAFHASNNSAPVGGPFPVQVDGAPREPDPTVVDNPNWAGPAVCVFPLPKKKRIPPELTPLPGNHDASPRTIAPGSAEAGGSLAVSLAETQRLLQAQNAELQRQKEQLAEERRKMEVEAVRKESQMAIERAERRAEELVKQQPAAPVESGIEKILAGMLPLAMKWFETSKADKAAADAEAQRRDLEMARMQQETQVAIAKAQAEAAAAASAQQAKMVELQMQMQMQLAAKAEESNKMLMRMLLDRPKDDSSAKTAELVSSMAGTTMNVLNTMVELGLTGGGREPEEPVALKAVREVVRGLALMSGNAARTQQPQPQFEALPEPEPEPELPPQQQEAPPEPAPLRAAEPSLYRRLVQAIKDPRVPPKNIATTVIQSLADPSLIEAFQTAGGDLKQMFAKDLDKWLDDAKNKARFQEILTQTATTGVELGAFPKDMGDEVLKMIKDF